jgi:hypothetical protein
MYSNNKQIRDVANIAAQIMSGQQPVTEKLHPNQQQLDVHEPEKDELTADDFKKLRAKKSGVVKEDDTGYQDRFAVKNGKAVKHNPERGEHDEPHHVWADSPEHAVRKHATMNKPKTEEVAEGFKFNSHERGAAQRLKDMGKNEKEAEKMDKLYSAMRKKREQDKLKKEDIESIDEVKMADLPVRKVQGRAYGASRPEPHAVDTIKGPNDAELKKIEAEKKKKKFSEMVNLYQDKGLKSLSEMLAKEEATEDEFNKEVEDAKEKNAGKKKNDEIAKGAVQAVKNEETHTTVEVIDLNDVNGVQYSEIELAQERTLTPAEADKKEEIVKSMKKGLSGFKERYGKDAKSVMYATATKNAKSE